MALSFRGVSIVSALAFAALAGVWMFAPQLLLSDWGVESGPSTELVGRRAAALFAGMSAMFFWARNAEPSAARSALLKGAVAACLILAALGIYELKAGHANARILAAVGIEITLSLAFLYVANKVRTAAVHNKTQRR